MNTKYIRVNAAFLPEKQAEREQFIENLYKKERKSFFAFAAQWPLSEAEIADLYQDAIIAFVENWRKGKVELVNSSATTYLYALGKYMVYRRLRAKNIEITGWDEATLPNNLIWNDFEAASKEADFAAIRRGLDKLGEQCQKLLTYFYYEGKKLEEIMELMGYDKKDVVKSQKSRCLKQLKNNVKKNSK
jgi:RNA polymerase sigma factor (sigma-70 family)